MPSHSMLHELRDHLENPYKVSFDGIQMGREELEISLALKGLRGVV